jgi:hypothetical protein
MKAEAEAAAEAEASSICSSTLEAAPVQAMQRDKE